MSVQLSSTHSLGDAMGGSEDPLSAYEGTTTQVLVERVDEGDLPAPLAGSAVPPAHHPPGPVTPLHPAHVLVGHQTGGPLRVIEAARSPGRQHLGREGEGVEAVAGGLEG